MGCVMGSAGSASLLHLAAAPRCLLPLAAPSRGRNSHKDKDPDLGASATGALCHTGTRLRRRRAARRTSGADEAAATHGRGGGGGGGGGRPLALGTRVELGTHEVTVTP